MKLSGALCHKEFFQRFVQLEKEQDLLTLRFPEGRQILRFYSGCDFVADIVDAEHVAGQKETSRGGEEKAAGGLLSFQGKGHAEQEVDQEENPAVMLFQAGAAAGAAFFFFTFLAAVDDPCAAHALAGPLNGRLE